MTSNAADGGYWTIQIKSVGDQRDFMVMLHPDDDLAQLYDEIHGVTGLPREQQRLIYRGRLLGKAENEDRHQKMKDIVGLMDGHTIHLMKGRESFDDDSAPPAEEASTESPSTESGANSNLSTSSSTSSLLASLLGGERNRRTPFRLREEDLEVPDPGPMESVRQGLMTMRTMSTPHPRQFYVGQWLDCRDTVNQWLEATVIDIVPPRDILRDSSRSHLRSASSSPLPLATRPTYDPAVGVTDLNGRRLLLLEACDESESEEQINGTHYRRRPNDHHVQIMHIHYNGWPVRWDEWIRSDSERIRPFRVRTRHPNSGRLQSPTVQAPMQNPPNTNLTQDESTDREAVLPELLHALRSVESLLENAVSQSRSHDTRTFNLPWNAHESGPSPPDASRRARQRNLRALAPALDRLGRTLTDSAPHIAALAASLDDQDQVHEGDDLLETIEEHPSTLGGLLSLLSRDRRPRRTSQSISSSLAVPSNDVSVSVASSTTGGNEPTTHEEDEEEEVVDPDLSDYNYGSIVNTTRGEVRTGPRATRPSGDDVAGLLGAYFAASMGAASGQGNQGPEGLGRLLRERGNGGIDIHIHAIVTEGGIGIATTNGAAPAIPTAQVVQPINRQPHRFGRPPQRQEAAPEQMDDDGIFSELYSENPEPVNPNSSNPVGGESWEDESTSQHGSSQASRDESGSPRRNSRNSAGRRNGVLGRFFRRGPDGE